MVIYGADGTIILDVVAGDDSYRNKRIMGENELILMYELPYYLEIPAGACVTFQGETYTLESPQGFTCHGDRHFSYSVTFNGSQTKLRKYMMRDAQGWLKFPFTATPLQHMQLLVANMNRRESGWSVGDCIESPDRTITYAHTHCMDALQMIANTFGTEWEVNGKVIHLRKVEYNKSAPVSLRYGAGGGFLPGLGRENFGNTRPTEILFVQGGRRNIDPSHYIGSELLLPAGQTLQYDGSKFAGETGFNAAVARTYIVDADGRTITRTDKPLSANTEDSVDLSEIYPRRIGTVTEVSAVTKDDTTFYDIIDSTIPEALNYEDYLIAGQEMTLIFQTGILAGREFDVKYIHSERKFEIVPAEIDGQTMPSATFRPVAGVTYAVFGCALPPAYIRDDATQTGASWDLFREAVKYKYENEDVKYSFTGELDELYADDNWLTIGAKLVAGGYVRFTSDKFLEPEGVLIRIAGVHTPLNYPRRPKLELSNAVSGGGIVNTLNKIDSNEVVNEVRYANALAFARRRYEDAKEAQEMLEAAFENFSPGIDPIWVRTMAVLVGNEYQQIEFVNNITDSQTEVIPSFTVNNEAKLFTAPATILKHCTLGIENTSSQYVASAFRYWQIESYQSPHLGDDPSPYYLTAQCAKMGTAGTLTPGGMFLLQKTYTYDPGDGYYYFLVGLLSSERDGIRSFATSYGFTDILPGQMRIKMIISPNGQTYFNVAEGIIQGNIRILSGSSGYNNLSDKPNLGVYKTEAEFNVFADQISATVTSYGTTINTLGQRVTVIESAGFLTQATGNTLWASKTLEDGNTIASIINQTATSIKIQANKVDLIGQVAFSMLDASAQAIINAKATASALGSMAYRDMVEKAQLGSTIISGGYILASLINVSNLIVSESLKIGYFTANMGSLLGQDGTTYTRLAIGYIQINTNSGQNYIGDGLFQSATPTLVGGSSRDVLFLRYSSGSSYRDMALLFFNSSAENNTWYFRSAMRLSHMPFLPHLSYLPAVANSSNSGNYAVRWDSRTGCLYVV